MLCYYRTANVYSNARITSLKVWLSTYATRSIFVSFSIVPFFVASAARLLKAHVTAGSKETYATNDRVLLKRKIGKNVSDCNYSPHSHGKQLKILLNKCAGRILRDQSKLLLLLLILITGIQFVSLFCNKGKPLYLIYCSRTANKASSIPRKLNFQSIRTDCDLYCDDVYVFKTDMCRAICSVRLEVFFLVSRLKHVIIWKNDT